MPDAPGDRRLARPGDSRGPGIPHEAGTRFCADVHKRCSRAPWQPAGQAPAGPRT